MGKLKDRISNIILAVKGKPWPKTIAPPPPIVSETREVHTLAVVVRFDNVSNPWLTTCGESTAKAEAALQLAEILSECGAIELQETERHPGLLPGTTSVYYGASLRVLMPKEG